jgi:hypothetical protein
MILFEIHIHHPLLRPLRLFHFFVGLYFLFDSYLYNLFCLYQSINYITKFIFAYMAEFSFLIFDFQFQILIFSFFK